MKNFFYAFLSFIFIFSFTFSSHAARELNLGCFEGYAEQEWIDEFEAKYDAKVKVKYVGSVDELFALTQASKGEDFDLISIDTSLFPRYHGAGLLKAYDKSQLSNFTNLMPAFQNVKEVEIDGGYYGVPISWGSLGLLYDVDEWGEDGIDSWSVMHDPANAGKMIILDDTNNNIVNTAIYLGMDNPYNLSEAEMEQVKQTLIAQKKLVVTYYAGFDEGNQIWDSGGISLMFSMGEFQEVALKDMGHNVKYTIPKEGGIGWLDTWAMTAGADEELAHAWADFFIEKSTQEVMNERYGYGTVTHESPGLDYADRLNWLQPAEDFEWRNRVWNEVKASN
jgi:putative spermidine/putrescine transport system substrate-binding protein/spermidine/putrescine transport system substrate-binding protein